MNTGSTLYSTSPPLLVVMAAISVFPQKLCTKMEIKSMASPLSPYTYHGFRPVQKPL